MTLLNSREAAAFLGIQHTTWLSYVYRQTAPPPDGYWYRGHTKQPYWYASTLTQWAHWHPRKGHT